MLPLIIGAAALAGGIASKVSNDSKNRATQRAYGKVGDVARQGADDEMAVANEYDIAHRMQLAGQLRKDANAYETNAAIQGGLAAYGGNPLSGGAANAVYDRLQQNARDNYQTSLANANSMAGADLATKLGIKSRLTGNLVNVEGAKADAKAAEKSAFDSFMGGAGSALSLGTKIAGMG